jgi:hypothetical protein
VVASAVLIIAISPRAPSPSLGRILVDSCSEAARPRECALASPESTEPPTASVSWTSPSSAEVRVEPVDGRSGLERSIEFRDTDAEEDRYRALGLVLAALASPPETEVRSKPVREAEPAAKTTAPITWVEGGIEVGRGLSPGPLRRGGFLSVGYRPARFPVFASMGAGFATSNRTDENITPAWTTFSFGIGVAATATSLDLSIRPRLDAVFTHAVAEIDAPRDRADSGSRWLPGAAASLELAWPASSRVGLVLGGAAHCLSGGTAVRVDGRKVSSFPAVGYDARLGLSVSLFP